MRLWQSNRYTTICFSFTTFLKLGLQNPSGKEQRMGRKSWNLSGMGFLKAFYVHCNLNLSRLNKSASKAAIYHWMCLHTNLQTCSVHSGYESDCESWCSHNSTFSKPNAICGCCCLPQLALLEGIFIALTPGRTLREDTPCYWAIALRELYSLKCSVDALDPWKEGIIGNFWNIGPLPSFSMFCISPHLWKWYENGTAVAYLLGWGDLGLLAQYFTLCVKQCLQYPLHSGTTGKGSPGICGIQACNAISDT